MQSFFQKMYNEYEMHGMTDEKIRTAHFSQVNIYNTYILYMELISPETKPKVVGDQSNYTVFGVNLII